MNRLIVTTTALVAVAAGTAIAEPSQAVYSNELERCVTALRTDISEQNTRQIRHFVTEVEKKGVWYEFDIRSELYDDPEGEMVKQVESRCRAHRWAEHTELSG